ncbi:MAG: YvcK family protein [Chloroflexi bacterium]|nr:YvcK family protein [Chloroflexota bacterium]
MPGPRFRRRRPSWRQWIRTWRAWLTPGLGIKRWLLLLFLGVVFLAVGTAIAVLHVYRTAPETWWLPLLSSASLRFLPRWLRALIFGVTGAALLVGGLWGLHRSLLAPFLQTGKPVVETLAAFRLRERGPHVAVLGGGHGQSTLLRGLKQVTHNITAIVSVADDGGSSGRLRHDLGILPPGDIRNCLAALSDDEDLLAQLFQYRFPQAYGDLAGHSFGNLFLTAMIGLTGSFEQAVLEAGRVLSIYGRVVPATLDPVELRADLRLPFQSQTVVVRGESTIPQVQGHIQRVWLEPDRPRAFPPAVQAILAADMVVVGPGSLFTSLLPNLLVPDLAQALRAARGLRVFVVNVATQPGETDGFSAQDHVRVVEEHVGPGLFDVVLVNTGHYGVLPPGVTWVAEAPGQPFPYPVVRADVASETHPGRHDPDKLARALMRILEQRTGPLP